MSVVTFSFSRRTLFKTACQGLGLAGISLAMPVLAETSDRESEEDEIIKRVTGMKATESSRVRLEMPAVFSNGHGVPMTLTVESPMTDADHVRKVQVLAPRNPILVVAGFQFTPDSGRAAVSTRIRLAESQNVLAVAEMSDGALLMTRAWVEVAINGCPTN